ncbi:MAG: hypothetical protein ACYS17_06770 [Planctomycetota bacterium]|jgi:hypothetical protein
MADEIKKKEGNPSALSRNWEKANKRNTCKKRRQNDRKLTKGEKE